MKCASNPANFHLRSEKASVFFLSKKTSIKNRSFFQRALRLTKHAPNLTYFHLRPEKCRFYCHRPFFHIFLFRTRETFSRLSFLFVSWGKGGKLAFRIAHFFIKRFAYWNGTGARNRSFSEKALRLMKYAPNPVHFHLTLEKCRFHCPFFKKRLAPKIAHFFRKHLA